MPEIDNNDYDVFSSFQRISNTIGTRGGSINYEDDNYDDGDEDDDDDDDDDEVSLIVAKFC